MHAEMRGRESPSLPRALGGTFRYPFRSAPLVQANTIGSDKDIPLSQFAPPK